MYTGLKDLSGTGIEQNHARSFNKQLDSIYNQVLEVTGAHLAENEGTVALDTLKEAIKARLRGSQTNEAAETLPDIMRAYIAHLRVRRTRNGSGIAANTLKAYNRALNAMEDYQRATKREYVAIDVDRHWHSKYLDHMERQGYKPSYAGKIMDCMKAALRHAADEGTKLHPDMISNKLPKIQPKRWKRATISPDELRHLMSLDLTGKLEKTRDLLVIGCWTALRVSDLMKLGDVKVQKDQDGEFIQVASTKIAGTYIEVPLHEHVRTIRDRWQGWPPAISDQRFNDYVKELCRLAGMNEKMHGELAKVITKDGKRTKRNVAGNYYKWELISSHTCRRSFATNFYGVLPTGDIMHVTGHASEAQLMEYIHAKPIDTRRRVRAAMEQL